MKQWLNPLTLVLILAAFLVISTAMVVADSFSSSGEVEVLTRGPIHEAFARPVSLDEGAGFMITVKPPAPIEEIIPDEKPIGNQIVWIPGYWIWDTDRNDFIWVSGCWRAVPPNTSWIPGYWSECRGGYQWIAGFWTTVDTGEIEYLPAPPATLEEGPPGTGPTDNIWIPGCWVRYQDRYAWRPGFWEAARADWDWVPAQYIFTPRGYVYTEGYWDYPLNQRGVMFLPVYCPLNLYGRTDFRFSPEIVFNLDDLTLNLFSAPARHHYYFGDYYGPEYIQAGYRPWYEASEQHEWYDPIFVHQQWLHRDDHQWTQHQHDGYDQRRDDKMLRPARTYEALKTQVAHLPEKDRQQAQLALPLKEIVAVKTTPFKFNVLDTKTRANTANQARVVHAYKDQRSQWESPPAASGTLPGKLQLPEHGMVLNQPFQKVKIPHPPITVNNPPRGKNFTPPPKPRQPNPAPDVRPKPTKDVPDHAKTAENADKQKHE